VTNVPRGTATTPDRRFETARVDTGRPAPAVAPGFSVNVEEPRKVPGLGSYLAVFALFCFGFFGVFAFLSMSLLTLGPPRPLRRVRS
jgi:hypothetical protein